jgi:nucleoside 2-deoxyribosyltransferase
MTIRLPKVYLSGPIGNCTQIQIHGWRDKFKRSWGVENCSDPTDRVFTTDQNYSHATEIVEGDKEAIDDSDVVLANISDPPTPHQMWGTPMEILYGWEQGKRVVVIVADKKTVSPWVLYHAHDIVTSVDEALVLLYKKYDNAVVQ